VGRKLKVTGQYGEVTREMQEGLEGVVVRETKERNEAGISAIAFERDMGLVGLVGRLEGLCGEGGELQAI
jgi:hypothetical protein